MRKLILAILVLLAMGLPAMGQVFNCSSFTASSGSCGVGGLISGSGSAFRVVGSANGATPALSSGNVIIAPSGSVHFALSMMYQTTVDIRAFTTTFNFIPNGQNIAFTINNCPDVENPGCGGSFGPSFSAGASCEGGFYQGFGSPPTDFAPINVFAMMFDNYGLLHSTDGSFTYSNVQIYQQYQSPCNPTSGGNLPYWSTTKVSTSPVPLNNPATSQGAASSDVYSATLSYDGSNFNLCLYDVTAANGSCSSGTSGTGTFYQKSWANVSIPSQVDGSTGYIGIVGSSGEASAGNLEVTRWNYTVNTASAIPGSTVTSAGSPTATNPSFSPASGTYSGTQNVTITSSGSSNICYALAPAGLIITPLANNLGGCAVGTLYSGPVAVSSSQTLYAVAGLNGTGTSSGVAQGTYTIGTTVPRIGGTFTMGGTVHIQ